MPALAAQPVLDGLFLPSDANEASVGPASPGATPAVPPAVPPAAIPAAPPALPAALEHAVWRGTELGQHDTRVVASGWAALDAELPGGGWPCQALAEVLTPQPATVEWRLLAPALGRVVADGRQVVVIGPPRQPFLPGLVHAGLDERQFVWVQAEAPAERLWATEQFIKAGAAGGVVAWLPQARQEQLRRLQVCAQGNDGLVFLCRPEAARHEASAAPLRVVAGFGLDWELHVQVFKRRGPTHEGVLRLPSVPGGLAAVLTPRLRRPSRFFVQREVPADVVGSPVVPLQRQPRPRVAAG
jgi:protein ImuA